MEQPIEIDIIILSYAHSDELKKITQNCIGSLIISESSSEIRFNIVVIESEKSLNSFQYENTTTLYPETEFGYHRYMNIGIQLTSSPYVCICNNDLIFHENWATNMLNAFNRYGLVSGSPACGIYHPGAGFPLDGNVHLGYRVRFEIAGWCLFFKRDILKLTGLLDPNLRFWFADNDYANTLWFLKLRHGLVTSSRVDHLESQTINGQTSERRQELTHGEITYSQKKWNYRMGVDWEIVD